MGTDGGGFSVYADFCTDCEQAAMAIKKGWPMPKINQRARPPGDS